jgi:hypothetical protein
MRPVMEQNCSPQYMYALQIEIPETAHRDCKDSQCARKVHLPNCDHFRNAVLFPFMLVNNYQDEHSTCESVTGRCTGDVWIRNHIWCIFQLPIRRIYLCGITGATF